MPHRIGHPSRRVGCGGIRNATNGGAAIVAHRWIEGVDDVKEQPFHQLDFVAGKELGHGFRLNARVKNMLNGQRTYKQGDGIYRRFYPGVEGTVNLSWNM